jgi:hypothetical protein
MATVRIGGVLVSFCATLFAQQAAGPPAFEVASIKPSLEPPGSVVGIFESKGRISAKNLTLKRCVRGAYNVPEPQNHRRAEMGRSGSLLYRSQGDRAGRRS